MRVVITLLALTAWAAGVLAVPTLRIVGAPENDVVRLLSNTTQPWTLQLYRNLQSALADSTQGDALLALADGGWPGTGLLVQQADYQAIADTGVRAYLEAPSGLPGDSAVYQPQPIDVFARAVVQGEGLAGVGLRPLDVMQVQGFVGQVYPQEPYVPEAYIVYAHVAGVDTAVYGLPPVSMMLPLLFLVNASSSAGTTSVPVLISAAKLSDMIRDRFAPVERFQRVWSFIMNAVGVGSNVSGIGFPVWTPRVHPALNSTALTELQAQLETQRLRLYESGTWSASPAELVAFQRATDWLASPEAGLLQVNPAPSVCPAPYAPAGANVVCMLEGYGSEIAWNGTQALASDVRMDCVAETAMAFALRDWLDTTLTLQPAHAINGRGAVESKPVRRPGAAGGRQWRRWDPASGALVLMGPTSRDGARAWKETAPEIPHAVLTTTSDFAVYAAALLNYTWLFSEAVQGPQRGNITNPAYGVMAWGVSSPSWLACQYADDNARVIQAAALAHVVLRQPPFNVDTAAWDAQLMRTLLANVRLASVNGYRPGRINYVDLETQGWATYANSNATYGDTVWPQPHYQAQIWQTYLWAFVRTGFRPFYDKAAAGVADMMAYYPASWHYTEYLSEEQARLLHTLAWLVRADTVLESLTGTPDAHAIGQNGSAARSQHLAWLNLIGNDILARQTALGGVQEVFGGAGLCDFCVPASNLAYGSEEAPVTQSNNDTCTDQLYSNNFLLLSLWEAYGATGDAQRFGAAADRLAVYLAAIQAVSEDLPQVSGSWPRAFDYSRWEYWGSSSDMGWGAFSVESGWTTTWIAAGLGLRAQGLFLWDLMASDNNGISQTLFAEICPEFFVSAECAAEMQV